MPLTYPINTSIPTIERWIPPSPARTYITSDWVGFYNWLYLPSEYPEEPLSRTLIMSSDVTNKPDAEIVIRNYGWVMNTDGTGVPVYPSAATGRAIQVLPEEGVTFEYAQDGVLGNYILPGGIMELKRLGTSNTWSIYGYIFASPVG